MGICSSCETTSVATAKLILQDGRLQEFSNPVKVSHVLNTMKISPMCFVCDSDGMDFGEFVRPVNGDEEMQLGQLYFVLPSSWLEKPLRAEQMAALAVRGSVAIRNMRRSNNKCFGCKRVNNQVVFSVKKEAKPSRLVVMGGGHGEVVRNRRGATGRGRGRHAGGGAQDGRLSVILEDDDMMEDSVQLSSSENVPMLNV